MSFLRAHETIGGGTPESYKSVDTQKRGMTQTTLLDTADADQHTSSSDRGEVAVEMTTCQGCHESMVTFSGQRTFCLRCTALICRHNLAAEDFVSGRLEEYASGELESDDWSLNDCNGNR